MNKMYTCIINNLSYENRNMMRSAMIFDAKNWTLCFCPFFFWHMRLFITRNSFFFHFVPFSVRKIAVYLTYFHRTRTKSVLRFRILLITESSILRKGSFPIMGQQFYHFFSFEKLFSHENL